MMWIVRLALRRPISVAVMALLMLVLGTLSFFLMNIDIFPAINVPVVMVVWNYPGMASLDMERRMVFISERAYSTTVNGIEHIESESMLGVGLLKVYFQPGREAHSYQYGPRHRAAADHLLQRGRRPGRATERLQRHEIGFAALRLRIQLYAVAALHDSRLLVPRSPGRCDPGRDGEYRPDRVVRQQRLGQ